MGLSGLPLDVVVSWVEASVARQGLTLAVTNPATIGAVVALLTGRAARNRAHARSAGAVGGPERSDAPDRLDSVGIEPVGGPGGQDHDVVDQFADDRGLAAKVERGPLLSQGGALPDQTAQGIGAGEPG
jgi:hypothetical protein